MISLEEYQIPTKLFVQDDYITPLREYLPPLGKSCIILTGKTSYKITNTLQPSIDLLNELGIKYFHSDIIEPNPTHEQVHQVAKSAPFHPDFILGIGGGSVLDAAKAVAFAVNGVLDLTVKSSIIPVKLAGICLASGTGSEVTQYSILTQNGIKSSIPNFAFFDVCCVPYSLQATLPQQQLNSTYWDIFCHSVESALNKKSTPSVLKTSIKALSLLSKTDLRSKALAAVYAGISISKAGTSVPHGLSYALTTNNGVSHGAACALFVCDWLDMFQSAEKDEILAKFCVSDVRKMIAKDIGRKPKLTREIAEEYAEQVMQSGKLASHFDAVSKEKVISMYME